MNRTADHRPVTSNRYLNAVLTAIACLLLLNLMAGGGLLPRSASAMAQPGIRPSDLPFNSGEQRNRQTAALDSIDARLTMIEAKLDKGLNVKVTEMPPVRLVEERSRDDRRPDRPAPRVEVRPAPSPAPAPAQPAEPAQPAADPR